MYYHITDPTFLHMRGMLVFDAFLKAAVLVLNGLGGKFDGRAWLALLSKHLDEDVQEQIKSIMPELTAPQYARLLAYFGFAFAHQNNQDRV
jgi:hypothetical protein